MLMYAEMPGAVIEPPTPSTPNALELDPVDIALSFGAGHPVRMLALLFMAERSEGTEDTFTGSELQRAMLDVQGSDIDGVQAIPGLRGLMNGLIRADLAFETTRKGRTRDTVRSFGITERGREIGVPLFASLLDLELTTQFSSQRLLGNHTAAAGKVSPAIARVQIFQYLQEAKPPVSLGDLYDESGRSIGTVSFVADSLAAAGALRILRKANPADRRLQITRPNSAVMQGYATRRSDENQALHDTLSALYRKGPRLLDGATLLQNVQERHPKADMDAVWYAVMQSTPHCLRFTDGSLYGRITGKNAPVTRVDITDPYKPVVKRLLGGIAAVRHSQEFRDLATKYATRIVEDSGAVAYLLAKARANSTLNEDVPEEKAALAARLQELVAGWMGLRRDLIVYTDWRERRACQQSDPELFFPLNEDRPDSSAPQEAVDICRGTPDREACAVRMACLKWAMAEEEGYGVWGGYGRNDRRNQSGLLIGDRVLLEMMEIAR